MYLKIEIDGEENYHSFPDKKRVVIGRSPTSDIQLSIEGISRHHIEIHEKLEGEYFVIDKGSTHGTFINETQLAKDKPVSFNTFFPAQLGPHVLIYLIDEPIGVDDTEVVITENNEIEEELDDIENELRKAHGEKVEAKAKPRIMPKQKISKVPKKKKPLIKSPTAKAVPAKKNITMIPIPQSVTKRPVVKKRGATSVSKVESKKAKLHKRKKKESTQKTITMIIVFLAIGYVGFLQWQKIEDKRVAKALEVQRVKDAELAEEQKELDEIKKRKDEEEKQLALEDAKGFVKEIVFKDKCLGEIEVQFCKLMQSFRTRSIKEGAFKELSIIYIVLDVDTIQNKFADYIYTVDEVPLVNTAAQRTVGRGFHAGYFRLKQKMKLAPLPLDFKNFNYLAFTDFLLSIGDNFPTGISGVSKLVLIAMKNDVYVSHFDYDFAKIQRLKLTDHLLEVKMLLKSNITANIPIIMNNYRYVEMIKN